MARTERQKLKLYYIIEYFKRYTDSEHPATLAEITSYLEAHNITAERKSLYRDIKIMEELGYEIIPVHSKQFMYYLSNRDFEVAELRMLVDAVQASRFITKKKSNELIRKLEKLTSQYDEKKLQSQVYVTNRIKASNESIYYNVDAIHSSIQDNFRIKFSYFDWNMKKRRVYRRNGDEYEVSPWALIWHSENYYLIGFDDRDKIIKHYRVDRMRDIKCIDKEREGRDKYRELDVALYAKKYFGMYNGECQRIRLNCDKTLANAVIDMFGRETVFEPEEDKESFNIDVTVAVSPVFLSWVFMFGGKIKIVSPQSVADELKEMAKKFIG